MSIYTVAMSTTMLLTSASVVNVIKYFKEIAVGICFVYLLMTEFNKHKLIILDWLVIFLFLYCAIYILIPLGSFTLFEKIVVFKSYGLFMPLYFIGRWMPYEATHSKQIVYWLAGLLLVACLVQFGEVLTYQHLQTFSGYTDYNQRINQLYSSGSYGLTQTFETDLGNKRFASFFNDPLDFAITLVLGICLMLSWMYIEREENKFSRQKLAILIFLIFALFQTYSRASMAGAVVALIYFSFLTRKRNYFKIILSILFCVIVIGYWSFDEKVKNYIVDTLLFRESSTLNHVLTWVTGIEAMLLQPFGLGLGSSGNYAFSDGLGIGGENQLIFMGVQTGTVSLLLYLIIFIYIWVMAVHHWRRQSGYEKVLLLTLALFKAASFIPMLTSYFESFLFVSYFTWALSGYLTSRLVWATSSGSVSTQGT